MGRFSFICASSKRKATSGILGCRNEISWALALAICVMCGVIRFELNLDDDIILRSTLWGILLVIHILYMLGTGSWDTLFTTDVVRTMYSVQGLHIVTSAGYFTCVVSMCALTAEPFLYSEIQPPPLVFSLPCLGYIPKATSSSSIIHCQWMRVLQSHAPTNHLRCPVRTVITFTSSVPLNPWIFHAHQWFDYRQNSDYYALRS